MSAFEDYSSWRLQTNGGIRYRFLGSTGSFTSEGGDIDWRAIIRSEDLYEVLLELFPPPTVIGGIAYPNPGTMPGFPSMVCKKLTYKNYVEGLPTDPYGFDTAAPMGTYTEYLEITINFGPAPKNSTQDPRTFLEVSCSADGEFIYIPATNTQLQSEVGSAGSADEIPGGGGIDQLTGEPKAEVVRDVKRPNRTPNLPVSMLVPTLKWSLKWKQIPANYFRTIAIHRLRYLLGRVNTLPCTFLYDAPPETLLFLGFSHTESYSWRNNNIDSTPIDVDIQILEKRVIHRGVVCGHNHVFEPGNGWVRQWIGQDGLESMYRGADMNFLFKV